MPRMPGLTHLAWRLMSSRDREMLLSNAPQYRRRHIDRVLKGKARYQPCFDRTESLFIHIPKSAGRSLCRGLYDVKSVEHASADWYQVLDPDKFQRYFKFTFVRNPWDRAVSAYAYLRQGGSPASAEDARWSQFINHYQSFDEFVCDWMTPDTITRNALFTPQVEFLKNIYGQIEMDFVGRFETLIADFDNIAARFKSAGTLPHLNSSRNQPYQSLYTDQSREIVANLYKADIDAFGYTFD